MRVPYRESRYSRAASMLRRALWISTLAACTAPAVDPPSSLVLVAPAALPRTFRPMANPAPGTTSPGLAQQLTDGSILVSDTNSQTDGHWWRLVPDPFGSYENATWEAVADSTAYAPLYFGSAVLPDGRFLVEGGEYLGGQPAFTKRGAIYDPVLDTWTSVPPPSSFHEIADASSVVLPDGRFMLTDCCSVTEMAIFNPVTFAWTESVGTGKADIHDEESWAELPDGRILTVDTNAPAGDLLHTEIYDPTTQVWSAAGELPTKLADTGGAMTSHEVGPEMLRPDGSVVAIGGTKHNAVYDIASATWSALPDTPGGDLGAPDGPGVVMPNGDIMFAVNPIPAEGAARTNGDVYNAPATFLELSGSTFTTLADQPAQAQSDPAYGLDFMMLPTGEVLVTDSQQLPLIYTPNPGVIESSRPVILGAPRLIATTPEPQTDLPTMYRGRAYTLPVLRMNGINFGAYYGDDAQMSTNFPLVRVTNHATSHVAYFRTYNHSHRSIAPDAEGTTSIDVPATAEPGLSDLEVVANGIASPSITVNVK